MKSVWPFLVSLLFTCCAHHCQAARLPLEQDIQVNNATDVRETSVSGVLPVGSLSTRMNLNVSLEIARIRSALYSGVSDITSALSRSVKDRFRSIMVRLIPVHVNTRPPKRSIESHYQEFVKWKAGELSQRRNRRPPRSSIYSGRRKRKTSAVLLRVGNSTFDGIQAIDKGNRTVRPEVSGSSSSVHGTRKSFKEMPVNAEDLIRGTLPRSQATQDQSTETEVEEETDGDDEDEDDSDEAEEQDSDPTVRSETEQVEDDAEEMPYVPGKILNSGQSEAGADQASNGGNQPSESQRQNSENVRDKSAVATPVTAIASDNQPGASSDGGSSKEHNDVPPVSGVGNDSPFDEAAVRQNMTAQISSNITNQDGFRADASGKKRDSIPNSDEPPIVPQGPEDETGTEGGEATATHKQAEENEETSGGVSKRAKATQEHGRIYLGSKMGMVNGENITQLSLMVYKIAKSEKLFSMAAAPCRAVINWMPEVAMRLEFELPGFEFYCVDTSEPPGPMADLKRAFGELSGGYIQSTPEMVDKTLPKNIDLVVSWMGMQEWGIRKSWRFIKGLRRSGVRLALFSNNPKSSNAGAAEGALNVRKSPLLFNEPQRVIGKVSDDDNKQLLLYSMDGLRDGF